jgi:hypothetical protein
VSAGSQPLDPVAVRFQLLDLLGGFLRTQALHTAARLGIAGIVEDEPVPVEALADRVGADPSALHRVMRLLASCGVFSEASPGALVSTPLSDGLREDWPGSVRYMAMLQAPTRISPRGRCSAPRAAAPPPIARLKRSLRSEFLARCSKKGMPNTVSAAGSAVRTA